MPELTANDIKELERMADECRGAFGEACRDPHITKEDFYKLREQYQQAVRRHHEALGY